MKITVHLPAQLFYPRSDKRVSCDDQYDVACNKITVIEIIQFSADLSSATIYAWLKY